MKYISLGSVPPQHHKLQWASGWIGDADIPGTDDTVSPYSTPEFCNIFVDFNDWIYLKDKDDKYAHMLTIV